MKGNPINININILCMLLIGVQQNLLFLCLRISLTYGISFRVVFLVPHWFLPSTIFALSLNSSNGDKGVTKIATMKVGDFRGRMKFGKFY